MKKFHRSPRHLFRRHAKRHLRLLSLTATATDKLPQGWEQLISYNIPGLQAGRHTIDIKQFVNIDNGDVPKEGEKLQFQTKQEFEAIAPRFSLPEDAIHSVYPPQGHEDHVEILPHVVFNDPTFPWERIAASDAERNPPPDYRQNRTPWLAVMIFTDTELRRSQAELDAIFADVPNMKPAQNSTFSTTISVQDISRLVNTASPIVPDPDSDEPGTKADIVFLPVRLFNSLFCKYNRDGSPSSDSGKHPYVYHHRFLAHRRDVQNEGMAVAAARTEEYQSSFGIVVSNRTGPVDISSATPVYVHLLSIEGVEDMVSPTDPNIQYVAMASLHSWSYVCLPPDAPNVSELFKGLGSSVKALKSYLGEKQHSRLAESGPVGKGLLGRLEGGFSLARYRVQTGEVSSTFMRGPYVPAEAPWKDKPSWWSATSMTGTDLQILDKTLGIMDITYSAAWQLGRTMAIADGAFTAALFRVRRQILQRASDATHKTIAGRHHASREDVLTSISDSIGALKQYPSPDFISASSMFKRWCKVKVEATDIHDLTYHGPAVKSIIQAELSKAAKEVASTPDPGDFSKPSQVPYDEHNAPFSTDWALVLQWVLHRYTLDNVPAHYLITDASHLPIESIRYFRIDKDWVDCFIDGAISLGNHIDQQDDKVRTAIKEAINWFLTSNVSTLGYPHPIPKFGCYIRSKLITEFPDLIISVQPPTPPTSAPVLLSHTIIDDGTMLCLFSESPGSPNFQELHLTQPPHQQCFSIGTTLTAKTLRIPYAKAYTVPPDPSEDVSIPLADAEWPRDNDSRGIAYLWNGNDHNTKEPFPLRLLLVENFANDYIGTLQTQHADHFKNKLPTSALMAFQLNSRSCQIYLKATDWPPPTAQTTWTLPIPPRKIYPAYEQKFLPEKDVFFVQHLRGHQRVSRKTPLQYSIPPPHSPMTRILPPLPPLPRKSPVLASSLPTYDYRFWPAWKPGSLTKDSPIPMLDPPLAQDIIFSVRQRASELKYDLFLQRLEIYIPLGNSDSLQPSLTPAYTGPGPSMLSNLRFAVQTAYSSDKDELIIRLFPRSHNKKVFITRCRDLSFMLAGVLVNRIKVGEEEGQPKVKVKVVEHYENHNEHIPRKPIFIDLVEDDGKGIR